MPALFLALALEFVFTFKTHDAYEQARSCLRQHSIPFNDYPKSRDGNPGLGVLELDLQRAQPCFHHGEDTDDA